MSSSTCCPQVLSLIGPPVDLEPKVCQARAWIGCGHLRRDAQRGVPLVALQMEVEVGLTMT
jgi:hypothetical protein